MKKKILAILISVIMLISIVPATGFALTSESFVGATVDFTGYTKNSTSSATSNKTQVATLNAGVAVDYEPVTGVFGKAADDVSVKATRITSSAEEGQVGPVRHTTRYNATGAGDWIDLNWEWAFGDMNVERYLNVEFYRTDDTTGTKISSFSYTGNTYNNDVLCVSPDGAISFFGKTLDTNYYFETDTWYNFDIRIKVGTDGSSKSVAYLYIDGILVGEKEINNDKDNSTTITNPRGIYWAKFTSKAVNFEGASEALSEVTYLDNIYASVFKNGAYPEYIPALQDYAITSESDNFITDGIHIALKDTVTVNELLDDLSYDTDAVKAIKVADINRTDIEDGNTKVTPGCFIHVETQSGDKSHHWYRKIVDNIVYISNSYDNGNSSAQPTNGYAYKDGGATSNYKYAVSEKATPDGLTRAMMIDKIGTSSNTSNIYYRTGYAGTIDSSKYVIEAKILRKPVSDDYPELYLRVGGEQWISMLDGAVSVRDASDDWSAFITKDDKLSDRWIKVAFEFDIDSEKAKIYINGEYTGVERTINNKSDWYSKVDIALGFKTQCTTEMGQSYIDDVKIYSGTYADEEIDVDTNEAISVAANDIIKLKGDVTVQDFIAETGADAVYAYNNGSFGAEVESGVIPANAVAIFKDDNSNIVKYFDIIYSSFIGDITFDTSVSGKISARVTINNKSELDMYKNAKLIIAAYDKSGEGKELCVVNLDTRDTLVIGENNLTATIDYDASNAVVAFLWESDNTPYFEAVPYVAD